MLPDRADIAAPPFPPGTPSIGGDPGAMERLTARGPVLVHFIDFAQLNSVRALPYVVALHERYAEAGLTVLGVHSARWPLSDDEEALAGALNRLGVAHPVAADLGHAIWHDYGCRGWPSLFLWARGGVLRWFHFGEGDYEGTERAVQEELQSTNGAGDLPSPPSAAAPFRRSRRDRDRADRGGAARWLARGAVDAGRGRSGPRARVRGRRRVRERRRMGELAVDVDGEVRTVGVDGAGLYELAAHPTHGEHELRVEPAAGVRIWSVSFAPGVPATAASSA